MASSLPATTVSAPGKIILFGEHSVVYGKVAIASSVNLRTKLVLNPVQTPTVSVSLPDIDLHAKWDVTTLASCRMTAVATVASGPSEEELVALMSLISDETRDNPAHMALVVFAYMYLAICQGQGDGLPPCTISVRSELPVGAGLGSSAAFSVALAGALLSAAGVVQPAVEGCFAADDLELINAWAFQGEKIIHGQPSGIDNSVSVAGGALQFTKADGFTQLEHIPQVRILLVNTKVPRSTKLLVAGVRERRDRLPLLMDPLLDSMHCLAAEAIGTLASVHKAQGDGGGPALVTTTSHLEELVEMNHHLLNAIGVGHAQLDRVCALATRFGMKAKLTGAGGGGCAFVLVRPGTSEEQVQQLRTELSAEGMEAFDTVIGGPGLRQGV